MFCLDFYHLQALDGPDARKPVFGVYEQQRRRPACAYGQSDQCLCYSLFGKYHIYTSCERNFKFLALLVSVAEQAGLIFTFLETPEHRFSGTKVQIHRCIDFQNATKNLQQTTFSNIDPGLKLPSKA